MGKNSRKSNVNPSIRNAMTSAQHVKMAMKLVSKFEYKKRAKYGLSLNLI